MPSTLDQVVVLSPHLDDGVLSLGGWMWRMSRRGSTITLVTVMAGDPDDDAPASSWDRRSGFRTAGEAAVRRREEDRRACAILGLRPVWLPLGDMLYGRGGTDDDAWSAIEELTGGADAVLAPGTPLGHPDHAWLARLVTDRRTALPALALYAEQPYRYLGGGALGIPSSIAEAAGVVRWHREPLDASARMAKLRAVRAYRSQLRFLSERRALAWRLAWARRGAGEAIAWLS